MFHNNFYTINIVNNDKDLLYSIFLQVADPVRQYMANIEGNVNTKPEELYQEWNMHVFCMPTTMIQLLLYSMGQPLTKALQPQTVSRTNILDWFLNFLF